MTPSAFGTHACSWDSSPAMQHHVPNCAKQFHNFGLLEPDLGRLVPQIPTSFRHPVVRNLVAEDVRDEFVKDFTQEEQKEDAKNLDVS